MRRYSQDEVTTHLSQQQQSGQSAQAYCRAQGLSHSTFLYWRRHRKCGSVDRATDLQFAPIEFPFLDPGSCEVRFPNGVKVCLPLGGDADRLARVLGALGGIDTTC